MAILLIKDGPGKGSSFELEEDVVSIGRDSENDISIQHQTVSRFHARIFQEKGTWMISDLDSRNGTILNGREVNREELDHMDEIKIGDVVMLFSRDDATVDVDVLLQEERSEDRPEITQTIEVEGLRVLRGRGRSDEELREENQKLVALLELGQAAGSVRNLPALFDKLTSMLEETLAPDRVVPILRDKNRKLVPYMRSKSKFDKVLSKVGISTSIVNHCLDNQVGVLSKGTTSDERFSGSASVARHKINTAMCSPMKIGEQLLGVIYVDRLDESQDFDGKDLKYLSAVALQVAVAVENIRSYEHIAAQARSLEKEIKGQYNIVGSSPAIRRIFDFIAKAAPTDAGVLITGESGTGKELVARAIHFNSPRREGPFEAVNCAAMNPSLIESELFGHVKGAFTGAVGDRPGRFELANEGSIFLDEIGDLPLECQTNLLRVLEEGKVRRVGDVKDREIDVRVVAATNRDLDADKDRNKFRQDLFYRLNVLRIDLPPLSQRGEDIEALARHFLKEFSRRCGRNISELQPEVIDVFKRYPWPGNVRELRNVIERMVIMSEGEAVGLDVLPFELQGARHGEVEAESQGVLCSLAELERRHILRVLDATQNNKKRAAAILGIDRSTLYSKLKSYGVG